MACLAKAKEQEDIDLLVTNRQRIQAMPPYWLEMLEIEIISRCFKHFLNEIFRSHQEIKHCPARTIATILNHMLGSAVTDLSGATGVPVVVVNTDLEKHKKKKNKGSKETSNGITDDVSGSVNVPETPDAGGSRKDCFEKLQSIAATRFCHEDFALISFGTSVAAASEVTPTDASPSDLAAAAVKSLTLESTTSSKDVPLLGDRVSRMTLLRRICQVAGIRVIAKNYDFSSSSPFDPLDIVSLTPLVKTCEQPIPMTEVRDVMNTARQYVQEGNLKEAFELAQEASQFLQQITGPIHKEAAMSMDLLTHILVDAGDNVPALSMACKSLSISVQLTGLDSSDSLQHHGQVAALLLNLGQPLAAVQHLLAAKYLVELMGGPRHPELVVVYLRLVTVYDQLGDYLTAQKCLLAAKVLCTNINKQCMISTNMAEILMKMGQLFAAVNEQKGVHKIMEQLFGEEHAMTIEAKSRVEMYHRKLTVDKVNTAREAIAMKELEAEGKLKGVVKIIKNVGDEKVIVDAQESEGKGEKKKSNSKKNKKTKK
jgi:tetratricopeptide (TPR) repeat protein